MVAKPAKPKAWTQRGFLEGAGLPSLGGLDLSPVVVILIIFFIERVIAYYIYPAVF